MAQAIENLAANSVRQCTDRFLNDTIHSVWKQFILTNHVYILTVEMEYYQNNKDGWEKQISKPEITVPA